MSVDTPETLEPTQVCPRCDAEYTGVGGCPACGFLREPVPCDDDPSRNAMWRCVLCGRTVCGDAGAAPARCDAHAHVPIIEGWAQVYTTGDQTEGALIVQNLQADGIDAQLFDQKDDFVFPANVGELAIVRVLVPVWEFQDALDRVLAYGDDNGEVSFGCPSCGASYEPGAAACPECGASLADTSV